MASFGCFGPIALILVIWLFACIKVVNEYERLVVFTLGKVEDKPKGPGLIFVLRPLPDGLIVSLRTMVLEVPSQDIITRDNVSLKVSAVVYSGCWTPSRPSWAWRTTTTPPARSPRPPCAPSWAK